MASGSSEVMLVGVIGFAFSAWVAVMSLNTWRRYGRLTIEQRYENSDKFKAGLFIKYPFLYLLGVGIGLAGMWIGLQAVIPVAHSQP